MGKSFAIVQFFPCKRQVNMRKYLTLYTKQKKNRG